MNFRYIVKLTLILLGCAAFAGAVVIVSQFVLTRKENSSPFERRTTDIEKRDLEILSRESAPPHDIYAALVRQGRRKVKEAREAAIARRVHSEAVVRAGAAEALGFFDDEESLSVVKSLLADPESAVRVRALEGLGNHRDDSRVQVLLKYLERPRLEEEEKVSAYSSLLRIGPREKRGEFAAELIRIARAGDGPAETRAAFRLISQMPRDESVLDLIQDKIREDKNERLIPVAIRHLAAIGDAWIAKQSHALSRHADSRVRIAIAQTLYRSCPDDRRGILESMLISEANPLVIRAGLRQLAHYSSEDAEELLHKIRDAQASRKEVIHELDESRSRPLPKEKDPCAS